MSKNWPDLIQHDIRQPETVAEAVDRLMVILEDEHKAAIAAMQKDDLVDLHFGLGLAIRNAWLNQVDSYLRTACGTFHPDDASHVIIGELWKALHNTS